jgi:hypothetical protein
MKLSFIIAVLLSITSISSAAILFWHTAPQSSAKKFTPQSSIEIKWGEGSEAGSPASTTRN